MRSMKVFTTGQVAKICKVGRKTVVGWFDSGRLRGYRIPGKQDRRIPKEYLIRFMKEYGIPLGNLENDAMAKVLIVSQDARFTLDMAQALPIDRSFKVAQATSGFMAGMQTIEFEPDAIVVDYSIGNVEAERICQGLRASEEHADTIIIAVLPDVDSPLCVDRTIVNESFKKPVNFGSLADRLHTAISAKKELV